MKELINLINNSNGLLTLIFSFFVMISTVIYAILTARLVNETRKMREVQTEPKIQITLETFDFAVNFIRLHIKNIGMGPAIKVKFVTTIDKKDNESERILNDFSTVKAFASGMNYFGPSQSVYSHFSRLGPNFKESLNIVFKIKANYQSITKKKYSEDIIINFSELEGVYQFGKPNLYSIAQSMEKIESNIEKIASGFKKIRVDVYDSKDREKERKYIEKQYKKK